MLQAAQGRGKFPLVRTFKPGMDKSTNSVYQDTDQAEKWYLLFKHCISMYMLM